MNTANGLGLLSIIIAGIAILPGSLGVLAFTHRFTAHPAGAFFVYTLSVPIYLVSILFLLASLYFTHQQQASRIIPFFATAVFIGLSIFGFLMHTRFMFNPVKNPQYISLDEAIQRFGGKEVVVGVVDQHGQPFAYIAKFARRPHIVYQTEGNSPFIMSHCILSNSSMAYRINERFSPDQIYISSVLANNLVFYDPKSRRSVQQIYNCSTDKLHDLDRLPTVMTSLASWANLYPDSKVWVRPKEWRDTFYLHLLARASVIDQNSPDLVYPLEHAQDPRLPLKSYVLGVEVGGQSKAYSLDHFSTKTVIEDILGNEPVVFFAFDKGDYVQLFSRRISENKALHFADIPGVGLQDMETSSLWNHTGRCIEGKLKGAQLMAIPHYNKIFWCVWADFYPSTLVFRSQTEAATAKNTKG